MVVDVTVAITVEKSTTGVEVLAKDDDALAGPPVRLTNVIVVLPSVKLEIAKVEKLAEQVKSCGPL